MADPVRIQIQAIGVTANVGPLGLLADGTLAAPRNVDEAGWFEGGPEPGERGPAVIAGHVDSATGPAVFYRLRELKKGDVVNVQGKDGRSTAFVVQRVQAYAKTAFPTGEVYGPTSTPTLRLITCGGQFNRSSGHYLDNVVVYAAAT